jgi:sugar-specific transcriptional regulator TrmB
MLVQKELISRVKDYFDLNLYETKVWLALLGKGIASAGQIAETSGVPRSRTYDVLETLEKKGFVMAKLGKPVKYLGVRPSMIIEKLKNNVQSEAKERIVNLSNLKEKEEFYKLQKIYEEGINPIKREEISTALKGKSNISDQLREVLENAKEEVIICTNASELESKAKLFKNTFLRLIKANIKIKIALFGDENKIKNLSKFFNIKIKKIDIDAKFFVVDKKEILFYLNKDMGPEELAIWLNSEFFASAFAELFEKVLN